MGGGIKDPPIPSLYKTMVMSVRLPYTCVVDPFSHSVRTGSILESVFITCWDPIQECIKLIPLETLSMHACVFSGMCAYAHMGSYTCMHTCTCMHALWLLNFLNPNNSSFFLTQKVIQPTVEK